jgi:hypothetical protein
MRPQVCKATIEVLLAHRGKLHLYLFASSVAVKNTENISFPKIGGKEMFSVFFTATDEANKYKCNFCISAVCKQNLGSGFANLWSHVKAAHTNYVEICRVKSTGVGPMNRFVIE